MAAISLTVNGRPVQVDIDPETPLLWALRDHFNLLGTKFGCGGGFCGACTVHLDGAATRSCSMPIAKAAGRSITTIEGLSANGDHPAQRAWEEIDVPQCGYCQAGQIMSCAALLARNAQSSGVCGSRSSWTARLLTVREIVAMPVNTPRARARPRSARR